MPATSVLWYRTDDGGSGSADQGLHRKHVASCADPWRIAAIHCRHEGDRVSTPTKAMRKAGSGASGIQRAKLKNPDTGNLKLLNYRSNSDAEEALDNRSVRSSSQADHWPGHLQFYLYTVSGKVNKEPRTFGVVCCHASDAVTMILRQYPQIAKLSAKRGGRVHYVAIGETLLQS